MLCKLAWGQRRVSCYITLITSKSSSDVWSALIGLQWQRKWWMSRNTPPCWTREFPKRSSIEKNQPSLILLLARYIFCERRVEVASPCQGIYIIYILWFVPGAQQEYMNLKNQSNGVMYTTHTTKLVHCKSSVRGASKSLNYYGSLTSLSREDSSVRRPFYSGVFITPPSI